MLQEQDPALTDLEGDEYCAGTDGESNHSHEGTHDQVWMKDFFLQWDQKKRKAIITDTVTEEDERKYTLRPDLYHRVVQLLWQRVLDLHRGLFWISVLQLWE